MNNGMRYFAHLQERDSRLTYSLEDRWDDRIAHERESNYEESCTGANTFGHADELSCYARNNNLADDQAEREHQIQQLIKLNKPEDPHAHAAAKRRAGVNVVRMASRTPDSDRGAA